MIEPCIIYSLPPLNICMHQFTLENKKEIAYHMKTLVDANYHSSSATTAESASLRRVR